MLKETVTPEVSTLPAITHDEYLELSALKRLEESIKAHAFDRYEVVSKIKSTLDQLEQELESVKSNVTNASENFVKRFKEILAKYEISETYVNVAIADSEPHNVTIVK